jgi:hypothetical protein
MAPAMRAEGGYLLRLSANGRHVHDLARIAVESDA